MIADVQWRWEVPTRARYFYRVAGTSLDHDRFAGVTFTVHARIRMGGRKISERQVIDILEHPDRSFSRGKALVVQRVLPRGRRIEIVYVEEQHADGIVAHVITVIRRAGASS
ncbi:MAG: DUF4258 domain-containing protein [Thermomicrobiales bacterium]